MTCLGFLPGKGSGKDQQAGLTSVVVNAFGLMIAI